MVSCRWSIFFLIRSALCVWKGRPIATWRRGISPSPPQGTPKARMPRHSCLILSIRHARLLIRDAGPLALPSHPTQIVYVPHKLCASSAHMKTDGTGQHVGLFADAFGHALCPGAGKQAQKLCYCAGQSPLCLCAFRASLSSLYRLLCS